MFTLTLVTPEKKMLTDVDVEEVVVPAFKGELTILPGHAPLMSTLGIGILRYRVKGSSAFQSAAISWGYCEVNPRGVNILAETAEATDELDRERIEAARKKADEMLRSGKLTVDEIVKYQRKLRRAEIRLGMLNKH